ncbi:MAG: ATP-binding cassette domain-containing protein, partial [Alphaproteobacteria bacterium]|nr:ATP-binding cassette domain-containing protein [Alphaproteobacteria bacterium]
MIEARDLVKRFNGFTAVDHISFAVPEGIIFGFLGPNGAGKTTTIKMLTTVLMPSEGRLLIAGHDPVTEPLLVRRAFGIVFQDPSLDDELSAAENMELHGVLYRVPRVERHERIATLLRFVGLWERRHDYVKRFSGGMKRRLEVARALQHRPRILFLDEPTSGLDPQTRNQIWEFIRGLCHDEHATVFFTTHYMEEAERVADQIAIIDHGRIVAQGTAAALRQETGGRTLEDAFITLTGRSIREAEAAPIDRMRAMRQVWRGR